MTSPTYYVYHVSFNHAHCGCCDESSDHGFTALISTTLTEEQFKNDAKEYAKGTQTIPEVYDFWSCFLGGESGDGKGFLFTGNGFEFYQLECNTGAGEIVQVDLSEIQLPDIFGKKKFSEMQEERRQLAEEKARKEREAEAARNRKREIDRLIELQRKYPDVK